MQREQDLRLGILNTLLTTPHADLEQAWPVHQDLASKDPLFYAHLAAWYFDKGEVRDHKELFVATLALSAFEGHRDVGLALLRKLPPYQVGHVIDFIHARLGRSLPRALRTEVTRYLREREADPDWFDSSVLTARKAMKRLYALLHVRPSERAQKVLFEEDPPADSRLFVLKELARASTPEEQARAIVAHKIPYRVAASVVNDLSPPVVRALVEVMSPQELINNLGSLRRRGALDDPAVKALVEEKLQAAQADARVSAYKAQVAAEAAGATGELGKALDRVTEARVKARGSITRTTALLLDKSSSMHVALEVGRQLGAMLSAACNAPLYAYAFDSAAHPIHPQGKGLADWERALARIHSGGSTSCGAVLDFMRREGQWVEQVVLVTDGAENAPPSFKDAYEAYSREVRAKPEVVLVKVGEATDVIERACKDLGLAPQVFEFKGDYYALPNLLPLLTQPSRADLLLEIIEYPLPQRRAS
jgi:hypothetical protein